MMNKLDDAAIEKLKAEKGLEAVYPIEDDDGEMFVVLRAPADIEWGNYVAKAVDPENRRGEQKQLVARLLVYPTPLEFSAFLQKRPAALALIMNEVADIAGAELKVKRRKL